MKKHIMLTLLLAGIMLSNQTILGVENGKNQKVSISTIQQEDPSLKTHEKHNPKASVSTPQQENSSIKSRMINWFKKYKKPLLIGTGVAAILVAAYYTGLTNKIYEYFSNDQKILTRGERLISDAKICSKYPKFYIRGTLGSHDFLAYNHFMDNLTPEEEATFGYYGDTEDYFRAFVEKGVYKKCFNYASKYVSNNETTAPKLKELLEPAMKSADEFWAKHNYNIPS